MELLIVVWILSAGLSYIIVKDSAPDKAPMAALLGFLLGPVGILVAYLFLKADND